MWPHDSFLGFLERASSKVTSLCIGFNPTPPDSPGMMGGMGYASAELEAEHVQAYLDLDNVADSLVTLHVRRDRPVWPEFLKYLTLPRTGSRSQSALRRPSSIGSLRSVKSRSSLTNDPDPVRLRKLEIYLCFRHEPFLGFSFIIHTLPSSSSRLFCLGFVFFFD